MNEDFGCKMINKTFCEWISCPESIGLVEDKTKEEVKLSDVTPALFRVLSG